jgi:hypothetical protein
MKKLSFYFLSMVLLLVGCKSNNSKKSIDQTEKPQKDLIVYTLKDEKSFDKQMMEIDSFVLAYGKFASSLDYGKEDKTTIHVDAHLDNEENIVKLVENFTDKDATSMGTNSFYLHDGKVFMSKEIFVTNTSTDFIERISYYAPNGICLKSKERKAVSEVSLQKAKFEAVPKTVCSIDRAMRALNQEKEFATTFQGFIASGKDSYMLVGTPGTGGFIFVVAEDTANGAEPSSNIQATTFGAAEAAVKAATAAVTSVAITEVTVAGTGVSIS